MSMPLRFAVSENAPTSLPFAGQAQSSRSSSPLLLCGARAASPFASGRDGGATATFSPAAADDVGVAADALASAISRTACSEYGSFNAFGADFTLSPARATTGGGAGFPSATTGGPARSGAVVTPVAVGGTPLSFGADRRSTWP